MAKTTKEPKSDNQRRPKMKPKCYLRPTWTHNGSIRTDLPLMVIPKQNKKKIEETLRPGQLLCVGKVYIKTHNGTIRI